MTPLFKKLNLGEQRTVFVLGAPPTLETELEGLEGVEVRRALPERGDPIFVLAFVTTQVQVDTLSRDVAQATSGDAVVWFAYPKQSSKRYRCDFNRDTGWAALGTAGFEPVRQVAIDDDWSALRFRRVEFIKKLTRADSMALSTEGKARARKA
ncbi:MAG: hypothetical protein ACOYM9_21100 [Bradymonadia bacterium]